MLDRLRMLNQRLAFTTPLDRWRVAFKNGYVLDRRFFLGVLALIVALFLVAFAQTGFGWHVYLACPADAIMPCENPYLDHFTGRCTVDDAELCSLPRLWPGMSYGEPAPALVRHFGLIVLCLVVAAVFANHLVHNRRFRP